MNLKIGLLIDAFTMPVWQQEIVKYVINHPQLSIKLVAINSKPQRRKKNNRQVYKVFRRLDRRIFKVKHDAFATGNMEAILDGIEILQISPQRIKFATTIPDDDLGRIKACQLDVLVRFGFGILKGGILKAARFGVWSLHHGDSAVNRGGPPAFWEIINREEVTGVTLQQLTEKLDGGVVLGKAFVRTDYTSFNRNQNAAFWAGVELFCSTLNRLVKEQSIDHLIQGNEQGKFAKEIYRDPSNFRALKIFTVFWIRRLAEALSTYLKTKQWRLFYKSASHGINSSMQSFLQLKPPKGVDWADPFIVDHEKWIYIFFEELIQKSKRAHIGCLVFDRGGKLKSKVPEIVLKETHHLSYPFIFEHHGVYYMVPESAAAKTVTMYRCEKFPEQWVKEKVLLNEELYDPTLVQHEGRWYLFGTQKPWPGNSPDQYLYIYYADDLMGEWKPHHVNPVTRDVRGARPAGRIIEHEGKLIRPAQIGAPRYGYGIRFQEIIILTPEEYKERPFHDILPDWKNGLLATHTFNFVDKFTVVDVQS